MRFEMDNDPTTTKQLLSQNKKLSVFLLSPVSLCPLYSCFPSPYLPVHLVYPVQATLLLKSTWGHGGRPGEFLHVYGLVR